MAFKRSKTKAGRSVERKIRKVVTKVGKATSNIRSPATAIKRAVATSKNKHIKTIRNNYKTTKSMVKKSLPIVREYTGLTSKKSIKQKKPKR